ncbi:MAG: hypothetical protein IT562_04675 [Alphaproteobacteria bacterium]|nr:hypothetical protein [Alphaproteobacteria bacterium]
MISDYVYAGTGDQEGALSAPRYKRNQIEEALWKVFAAGRVGGDAPRVFATRIKRLLELDRAPQPPSAGDYAFHDDPPRGLGVDTAFSELNVFCLAIGLDLLDIGFKQQEVVFLLKHIRPELEKQHRKILHSPPAPRQLIPAEDRPDCPAYMKGTIKIADCRVFLSINKVEITELYPRHDPCTPLIFAPRFIRGIEALRNELQRMNYDYRRTLVLEIAELAVQIGKELAETEPTRRGRHSA